MSTNVAKVETTTVTSERSVRTLTEAIRASAYPPTQEMGGLADVCALRATLRSCYRVCSYRDNTDTAGQAVVFAVVI